MALSWMRGMLKHWSRPVSRSGPNPSRSPRRFRPRVEALEDRQVPTVSFFGGNVLPQVQAQALYLGNEFSSAPANAGPVALDSFLRSRGAPAMP